MMRATKRLSELADFIKVQIDPARCPNDVYVGLEHISSGRFTRDSNGKASDVRSSKFTFEPGDVLYGKLRPYLDKAVLVFDSGICTTELLVLRPKEGVDPRFLVSVIHTPAFIEHAISGTTGVQHPRTSWKHISDFEIPAFDSDDQTRIADLLWAIHTAITANDAAIEVTAELKCAAMRALFTRGLRGEAQKETEIGPMPKNWDVASLGSLCTPTRQLRPSTSPDRWIRYVDVSSVSRMTRKIESTTEYRFQEAPGRARKEILFGDVIFATIRPTLLRAARVEKCLDHQICSTAFCVLRDKDRKMNGKFLFQLVQRDEFIDQLGKIETGTSYPAVNDSQVMNQLVPVPPEEERNAITEIIEAIDCKIDLHRRKRAVLKDLFKALLHRLMTGEICVAQLDLSGISQASLK